MFPSTKLTSDRRKWNYVGSARPTKLYYFPSIDERPTEVTTCSPRHVPPVLYLTHVRWPPHAHSGPRHPPHSCTYPWHPPPARGSLWPWRHPVHTRPNAGATLTTTPSATPCLPVPCCYRAWCCLKLPPLWTTTPPRAAALASTSFRFTSWSSGTFRIIHILIFLPLDFVVLHIF
jgi:hypothetical protein